MNRTRRRAARLLAALAALFWGWLFFGVNDFLSVFIEGSEFAQHYIVESGWGLMFLVMVAVPFGALVVRPGRTILVWSLLACGVALVVGGLFARSLWQTLPGLAVAATAGVVGALGGASFGTPEVHPDRWLTLLSLAASIPALWYAGHVAVDSRAAEETWAWTHGAVQAGVAVAIVLVTALVALTPPQPGRVLVAVTATFTAGFLGIESMVYPDRVGTLGTTGGAVAALWSAAFMLMLVRKRRQPIAPASVAKPA